MKKSGVSLIVLVIAFLGLITVSAAAGNSSCGCSNQLCNRTSEENCTCGENCSQHNNTDYLNYTGENHAEIDDCFANSTDAFKVNECITSKQKNISFCDNGDTKNFTCGDMSEVEMCRCESGRWNCDIHNVAEICSNRTMNMIRERIQNKTNMTFVPWQKINESECMDGCKCRGAVVSCQTQNGRTMNITAGNSGNYIYIYIEQTGTNASTKMEIRTYRNGNLTTIKVIKSNGEETEIEVLPDQAQEIALEKMRVRACNSESRCNLTLKEDREKLKYEMQLERHSRILGIFSKKMQVKTQVDAENGEVAVYKPWWAFLATEPKE
jgi:hypothetical protein